MFHNESSFMESHPLFWLEFCQARRSGTLIVAIILGILMGLYLFAFSLKILDAPEYMACHMIPFFFFPISVLLVSRGQGPGIAQQQLNDDLILVTPLSPFQVVSEKFGLGLLYALIFYGPTVPGCLLGLVLGDSAQYWFCCCLFGFVLSLSLLAIGIGFMAGAKTMLRSTLLICFGAVFVIAGIVIAVILAIVYEDYLTSICEYFNRLGYPMFRVFRDMSEMLIWFMLTFFTAMAGLIGFVTGVLTFRSNRKHKMIADVGLAVLFIVTMAANAIPVYYSSESHVGALIFMFFTFLIFFGMPYAAICLARWGRS